MRIRSLGLNLNGTKPLRNFLVNSGFETKVFYPYASLTLGQYSEDINGINDYLNTLDENTFEALLDFPACLNFENEYARDPNTKFIYIQRDIDSWLDLMKYTQSTLSHNATYLFEEAYCKRYIDTDKTKMQDLTEEELRAIYAAHDAAVTSFFEGKPNYIKIMTDDPQISAKLRTFLSIVAEIDFDITAESKATI